MIFNHDRIIHSFKTGIACLLGFLAITLIHFRTGQWLIITVLIVMTAQISVGGVLQKSLVRFLGTLIGSIIACLALFIFKANPAVNMLIVALSAMIFSYAATGESNYNEAGALGAVTVAIILAGTTPTLNNAVDRFIEINIGILIAALVSRFILPIHARKNLKKNQIETLKQLNQFYQDTLIQHENEDLPTLYIDRDENLAKSLIKQRKLAAEAARERIIKPFDAAYFGQLLWHEKEIFRSISFMYHASNKSIAVKTLFYQTDILKKFHHSISMIFSALPILLQKKSSIKITEMPSIGYLKNDVTKAITSFSEEDQLYVNGFLFSAEILVERLNSLITMLSQELPAMTE